MNGRRCIGYLSCNREDGGPGPARLGHDSTRISKAGPKDPLRCASTPDWIEGRPGQTPFVGKDSPRKKGVRSCPARSRGQTSPQALLDYGRGCLCGRGNVMASHALAIHGSGGGRRVGVLESWTLAGMRGLHNKSLKLTPKAYLWFVWGPAASRSEGFAMADSAAQLSSMLGHHLG